MKIWKNPSKAAYLSKIAEIFSTGLAASTTQNAEFYSTKSLLIQDWVLSKTGFLFHLATYFTLLELFAKHDLKTLSLSQLECKNGER